MRRAWFMSLALCVVACDQDAKREVRLKRSGSNAAVVILQTEPEEGTVVPEVEPNHEAPQQTAIGARIVGSLEGSLDVDRYQVRVEDTGMLFALLDGASDADLMLRLEDAAGLVLAQSDRGPAGLGEGISGYPVLAGSVYQLVVSEFTKKKKRKAGGRSGVSAPYALKTRLQAEAEVGAETETLANTPTELVTGAAGYGYIGWKGDQDLWHLPVSLDSDRELQGEFDLPTTALDIYVSGVEGVALHLEIADAEGTVLASLRSAPGQEVAYRGLVPEAGAEFYRIAVEGGKRSNPIQAYVLRADRGKLGEGQESEPNDTLAQASAWSGLEGQLQRASGEVCLGDVDNFSIAASSSSRLMDVVLTSSSQAQLVLSIVSENGAIVAQGEPGQSLQSVALAAHSGFSIAVSTKESTAPVRYKLALSLLTATQTAD